MTDKLTPPRLPGWALRDLASLLDGTDTGFALHQEAARRDWEATPPFSKPGCFGNDGGTCVERKVCPPGECFWLGKAARREAEARPRGPLTGIEAGPDAVHPKPPCDEPAPAADEMAASILALEHRDPCYPTPHPRCVTVAEFIRAQARVIVATATLYADAVAENARLREALAFYAPLLKDCNRISPEGMAARNTLAKDRGDMARAALARGGDHG